ncbi:MAG: AhpC/TSA family protein [Verrucomicrobiales bacterium]
MGEQKDRIEDHGWRLVVVHMQAGGAELPIPDGIEQLDDPHCELYRSFGLAKASIWQVLRPRVWIRSVGSVARGYRGGALAGDGLQLPGTFLVRDAGIAWAHRAEHVADHWAGEISDALAAT